MENKELTFNQIAKIAEQSNCVLLSNAEWSNFTKRLWALAEENKRLKQINERLRGK